MYRNHTIIKEAELKVLQIFLDFHKHYFAEISKKTTLTRPRTMRVLRKLTKQSILEQKPEANVKFYHFKRNNFTYTTLSLIEYNQTSSFLEKNKTLRRALEMLEENYTESLITTIFGSQVKGTQTKHSDIDLLLIKENFSKKETKEIEDIIDLINGRTGLKLSPHLMTLNEFNKKNNLAKEVIENHIIIKGAELFLKMVLE